MVAGPALAGVLVATTTAGTAIAVDAGTFLVSAAALAAMGPAADALGNRPAAVTFLSPRG